MKVTYQLSSHGAGRWSVQVFRKGDNFLLEDCNIVWKGDHWRVVCVRPDPAIGTANWHRMPEDAAKWYADIVSQAHQ